MTAVPLAVAQCLDQPVEIKLDDKAKLTFDELLALGPQKENGTVYDLSLEEDGLDERFPGAHQWIEQLADLWLENKRPITIAELETIYGKRLLPRLSNIFQEEAKLINAIEDKRRIEFVLLYGQSLKMTVCLHVRYTQLQSRKSSASSMTAAPIYLM